MIWLYENENQQLFTSEIFNQDLREAFNLLHSKVELRTKWIQETIRRKQLNKNSFHHHSDFVVEFIEDIDNDVEYWGIGS